MDLHEHSNAPAIAVSERSTQHAARYGITSAFGNPLDPRTWSAAPYRIAAGLRATGCEVFGVDGRLGRLRLSSYAMAAFRRRFRRLSYSEAIGRTYLARRHRARRVARAVATLDLDAVLHTGSLDLPPERDDVAHYLYCDQTWNLSLHYRPDRADYTDLACAEFDELERASFAAMRHIFTFGEYVRDDLIAHYGIAPERVTAVGSGMGQITPYYGPKDYAHGPLLFVAKHLFAPKGGALLLEAFARVRRMRPDLKLVMVAPDAPAELARSIGNVSLRRHVPWPALENLYRSASLLVQPMLNDPWGQVYLEALLSRTPVMGLARNGLPEIVEGGRHGFLVPEPAPEALAHAIVDAMADPDRLALMGASGQAYVERTYSWDRTSGRIADVLARHASVGVPLRERSIA